MSFIHPWCIQDCLDYCSTSILSILTWSNLVWPSQHDFQDSLATCSRFHIYTLDVSSIPFPALVHDYWPLYWGFMDNYYYLCHIFIIGHGIDLYMHFQMDICGMSSHYYYFWGLWITWYTQIVIMSSIKVSYGLIEDLQSISAN